MTATELLNQIRQEIERRIELSSDSPKGDYAKGWYDAHINFCAILDTLQVDGPEGLDEAADTFNREDAARMWEFCTLGGICTNPFHDCINCSRQSTIGISTTCGSHD